MVCIFRKNEELRNKRDVNIVIMFDVKVLAKKSIVTNCQTNSTQEEEGVDFSVSGSCVL